MGLSGLQGAAFPLPSIVGVMARGTDSNTRLYSDPLPSPCPQLHIDLAYRGLDFDLDLMSLSASASSREGWVNLCAAHTLGSVSTEAGVNEYGGDGTINLSAWRRQHQP